MTSLLDLAGKLKDELFKNAGNFTFQSPINVPQMVQQAPKMIQNVQNTWNQVSQQPQRNILQAPDLPQPIRQAQVNFGQMLQKAPTFGQMTGQKGYTPGVGPMIANLGLDTARTAGNVIEKAGKRTLLKGNFWDKMGDITNIASIVPMGSIAGKTTKFVKPQELSRAVELLQHNYSAYIGKAGKTFAQKEIDNIVSVLSKKVPNTNNVFLNDAIKAAKYIVMGKEGMVVNKPNIGMTISTIKKAENKTQGLEGGVKGGGMSPTGKLLQESVPQSQSQLGNLPSPQLYQKSKPVGKMKFDQIMKEADKSIEQPNLGGYSAVPQPKTITKIKARNQERTVQDEFKQWQSQLFKQENVRTTNGAVKQMVGSIKTSSPLSKDIENMKDISGFVAQGRDVYRNFKAVFGKNYETAKKLVLDPFDKSKGDYVDMQKQWLGDLETNVVKKLGIKAGSKESELTQLFGEKQITLDELRQQAPKTWQNIVEADSWFRNAYNTLLDDVNAVRARIYPNQPDKIIPQRADYYRHFREMQEGLGGLKNIFENPSGISSSLSGISEYAKPKAKWLSFAQKRLGMATDTDAVGGFLNYLKSASYAKNIDPHISKFRNLADELAQVTAEGENTGNLNNFIEFLQDYSNDLSGKTNSADRFVQKIVPGGRKTFAAINWLNNRVKANTILGNASSSIAQIFNVPQGIASAGIPNSIKGLGKSLASIFTENKPMQQSTFLKERYFRDYNKFDTGLLNDSKRFAAWMVGALDDVGSRFIWNAHYEKALSEGIANPVKYADDFTREMVAGRGIGEVPLIQKSKLFQLVAPFQLEVGNLWWVMKDMVDEKAFGKLATLFVANYVFNKGAEAIRGSGVTFDPIQAMMDAGGTLMSEDDKKKGVIMAGGRLTGEVLGNMPLAQSAAQLYPEYGNKDLGLPTRKQFFGREDPTRFGSGLVAIKGLQDPLYKVLPPFAGGQIKKTVEGTQSFLKGYVGKEDAVKYPIEQNPVNAVKSALFGQYGTPEAKQYFDQNRRVLSEKQSEFFNQSQDKTGTYNKIITGRENNAKDTKAKEDLKANGGSTTLSNGKISYLDEYGETKTIDLNPPTKGTGIDAYTNQNWNVNKALQVYSANVSQDQKNEAYKKLGVDPNDMEYAYKASKSNDIKTQYAISQAQSLTHEQLIERLITGRVQSVAGDFFATDGVLTNLNEKGLISDAEAKALKAMKLDKTGKTMAKVAKPKKPKKITITTKAPKLATINIKRSSPKMPSLKLKKAPVIKLKKVKKAKIKLT